MSFTQRDRSATEDAGAHPAARTEGLGGTPNYVRGDPPPMVGGTNICALSRHAVLIRRLTDCPR